VTTPDVRVLGLCWTLAGPVQVARGREWSLFLSPGDDRRDSADGRRRLLFDAGAALRAHHMKVGNLYGTACALNQVTDEFAALCAAAAQASPAIVYGSMPFDANVNSADKALAVVAGANAGNGGSRSAPGIWESSGFPSMTSARSRRNSSTGQRSATACPRT
jgi:hypothetical protein